MESTKKLRATMVANYITKRPLLSESEWRLLLLSCCHRVVADREFTRFFVERKQKKLSKSPKVDTHAAASSSCEVDPDFAAEMDNAQRFREEVVKREMIDTFLVEQWRAHMATEEAEALLMNHIRHATRVDKLPAVPPPTDTSSHRCIFTNRIVPASSLVAVQITGNITAPTSDASTALERRNLLLRQLAPTTPPVIATTSKKRKQQADSESAALTTLPTEPVMHRNQTRVFVTTDWYQWIKAAILCVNLPTWMDSVIAARWPDGQPLSRAGFDSTIHMHEEQLIRGYYLLWGNSVQHVALRLARVVDTSEDSSQNSTSVSTTRE
jgi:hypothetical protein